jgi:L-2,4-diaminobutyrate decarboxylase
VEAGSFHLTQVKLGDKTWLRTTVMNPMTQAEDLTMLMERLTASLQDSSRVE